MPPRVPRAVLERELIQRIWTSVRERTAIAVIAPAGFGKTTLLAQWRCRWLEQGALVAWLTVDAQDDPMRFAMGLLHAIRSATGRPAFDALLAQYAEDSDQDIDALTALLAEIAYLGMDTVLMVDDAERLPDSTVHGPLQYLLHNAPPNLHVVIGSRVPVALQTWELAAMGSFATIGPDDLRLQLDESTALLGKRFGQRLSLDECARLHEVTEGWPLGLQLVAATIEPEADLSTAIDSLSARHGDIARYFIESLLSRLPPPVADFLIRVAILEHMSVELCEAVTGCLEAADYLDQLMRDTPILIVGEQQDCVCLHPLARDFLLSRFEQLPVDEQEVLQCRAFHWFAKRERFHEAACHALAAGDESAAQAHAVRSLWTLGSQGKLAEARAWLERIPVELLDGDVELRLIAARIMALGDRHEEALEIAQRALRDPATTPQLLALAARVAGGAAAYADRVGLIQGFFSREQEFMATVGDSVHAVAYGNMLALVTLHEGATDQVRRLVANAPTDCRSDPWPLALAFSRMLAGLSYFWDGDAYRTETTLRPALIEAERRTGRRSMVSCLIAAVLAAALLERDQPAAAQAMLAHRLDVIERVGLPDTILLAYRTLAYVALSQGDEGQALRVLGSLAALAEARRLPRLLMHSYAEQIRIYSLRACTETVDGLVRALDQLAGVFTQQDYLPFNAQYGLVSAIAKTHAALARHDLDAADQQLEAADAFAARTHRARDALTIKVLRAVVARQRNADHALPLLAEALSLAAIGGSNRLLADIHPLAVRMGTELHAAPARAGETLVETELAQRPYSTSPERPPTSRGGLLTTKEAQILALLEKGMSNKLIARAMGVSDETVKWHIKNLFLKLAAGTRKHAVDRARLLGLLAD